MFVPIGERCFMRFAIGDLIIYGETGVCRVDDIVEKEFAGSVKQCYRLCPLYQSCTIFTPADNENVYMRPIISRAAADALIESINTTVPEICTITAPRELSEKYDKIIKLHDCGELISLTMSIHHKKARLIEQKKKLSAVDERYMKKAEELLFGELAAALGIEKSSVKEYIESKVK